VRSPLFQLMLNSSATPMAWPTGAIGFSYRYCGRYAALLMKTRASHALALRWEMRRIAQSMQIAYRVTPPIDIHHRVAVHARRGDKIGAYGSLEFFDRIYEHAMGLLIKKGHKKVHLCTDDRTFEPELVRRFEANGFEVTSTAGASPEDDAELMRRSKYIVAAATQSSFSLLAAMLGGRKLYCYHNATEEAVKLSSSARSKREMYASFGSNGLIDMLEYGHTEVALSHTRYLEPVVQSLPSSTHSHTPPAKGPSAASTAASKKPTTHGHATTQTHSTAPHGAARWFG